MSTRTIGEALGNRLAWVPGVWLAPAFPVLPLSEPTMRVASVDKERRTVIVSSMDGRKP